MSDHNTYHGAHGHEYGEVTEVHEAVKPAYSWHFEIPLALGGVFWAIILVIVQLLNCSSACCTTEGGGDCCKDGGEKPKTEAHSAHH